MKCADLFKLIVRTFGVFLLYQTMRELEAFLAQIFFAPFRGVVFMDVILLGAAAVWFLFGAPPIQKWAYPDPPKVNSTPEDKKEEFTGPPCVSCGKHISAGLKICPFCGWTQPG